MVAASPCGEPAVMSFGRAVWSDLGPRTECRTRAVQAVRERELAARILELERT
jgi:hypothetical protein